MTRRYYADVLRRVLSDPDARPSPAEADPGPRHVPDGCAWCVAAVASR